MFLVPGAFIGWIGYITDTEWAIGLGQFLISLSGAIVTGVLAVFYLKIGVITTHVLVGIDGVLEFVSRGKIKNFFSKDMGANIRQDLLNAFAWVAVFLLWCSVVPVWKHPTAVPLGATFSLFFAFASSRLWELTQKRIGKAVVFTLLALAFVFHSFNVCMGGAMSLWVSAKGDVAGASIRTGVAAESGREEILEERISYEEAMSKVRVAEYRNLGARQIWLSSVGQENSAEFRRNARRMRELESGNRPVKRNVAPNGEGSSSFAAGVGKLAELAGANWGWLLIGGLSVFLFALFIVGLVAKRNWLAAMALAGLLLAGFAGVGYWLLSMDSGRTTESAVEVPREPPIREPLTHPETRRAARRSCGGCSKIRAEVEDIGRNLDVLAAQ
ncbi:MAG: hypothetical protein HYS76_00150 [Candidatus Wildermuthbacteria bacterium]|nr:hypothetical protein [Candidatus Wildermuthbacteria bacterium]